MTSNERGGATAPADAQRASVFGSYRLLRLLGVGGMAEVWSGEELTGDGRAGRPVAVKRILPHLCDDLAIVEMFLSEARLATLLKHPNIVRAYEVGILQRQPFIAMELVSGIDLRRLSAASPAMLPIGFCLSTAIQICEALAYVHALRDRDGSALGLIHRDISHSNVMLTRSGGVVKLLDFGVAKAGLSSGLQRTRTGELKGKLGYMAPELLKEERYDHRADLFSVGVVLWELLTLQRLFKASTEASMLMMNLACQVSAPSQLRPELPAALDGIVLRALAADPERRYGNAAEMAEACKALAREHRWTTAETVALIDARLPAPSAALASTVHAPAVGAPSERAAAAAHAAIDTQVSQPTTRRRGWIWGGVAVGVIASALAIGLGRTPSRPAPVAPSVPQPAAAPATDDPKAATASKRPAVATHAAEPHKPAPAHHRHKAAETLMGHDELMNPLTQ